MSAVFISEVDREILGTANSIDGMGALAVWTTRARELIPHLTAQTVTARGFQVLVEVFRLWEEYVADRPDEVERSGEFFVLIEQVFARVVGQRTGDWSLPGRRRVRARRDDTPCISLDDPSWHLLKAQRGNGLWGLYRRAAARADLLDHTLERIDEDVLDAVDGNRIVRSRRARNELFAAVIEAMSGGTASLSGADRLAREILEGWERLPLSGLLWRRLVEATDLTQALTERSLAQAEEIDHRQLLQQVRGDVPEYDRVIGDVIRCEDFIGVLESIFDWLRAAAASRPRLTEAADELPVDLGLLMDARDGFFDSGAYDGIAEERHRRFAHDLDLSSTTGLVISVLNLHAWVARSRNRALWVWEESGRLVNDVDSGKPSEEALTPGLAWRNDYFLSPLRAVAAELREAPA